MMIERALRVGVVAAFASALALLLLARAPTAFASAPLLARAPAASAGWQRFVLDNPSGLSYPRSVQVLNGPVRVLNGPVRVLNGPVRAPGGLLGPGGPEIELRRGARLVIDMGEEVGGWVEVGVTRARGQIRLSYSESRGQLRRGGDSSVGLSLRPEMGPFARTDVIAHRGLFRSPGIRGGERYVLLEAHGSFALDFLRVRSSHLDPRPSDYVGNFYSSSGLLNRIWYAGAYTLDLDTAHSRGGMVVIDGAKRDRLVWLGDLEMEALVGSYTVRQMPAAIERSLAMFSCQQWPSGYIPMASDLDISCPHGPGPAAGPPTAALESSPPGLAAEGALPAYTAAWVATVCERYMLSGDTGRVRTLLPTMQLAVEYLRAHLGADGLFRGGSFGWDFFDQLQEADTFTNALWVQALHQLVGVEARLGEARLAAADAATAQKIAAAVRARLYDPGAGLFVGGSSYPDYPQDANVEAVLSGIAGKYAGRVLDGLKARLSSRYGPLTVAVEDPYAERFISPFMSGWQLIALFQHHRGAEARQMIDALWGHMVRTGPGTMWEAMGVNGRPLRQDHGRLITSRTSLAHGWSTAPTYALSAYVLGMRPTSPGWRTWTVEPQPIGLRFASGSVGTPYGSLGVGWRRVGGGLQVTVDAPHGTHGRLVLPGCGPVPAGLHTYLCRSGAAGGGAAGRPGA